MPTYPTVPALRPYQRSERAAVPDVRPWDRARRATVRVPAVPDVPASRSPCCLKIIRSPRCHPIALLNLAI
ncbi:hypothetical protein [Microcoleus sp. EPA2]|uniref:hypothetical protein n=1 Tax=Microcoleus sp. EPA2 TaxID=2841654 RepID=UPI00312BA2BF